MSDVAIRIENLGKKYRIGTKQARYQTLRESLTGSFTNIFKKGNGAHKEDNTIWALKDIDLEVKHGEVLGIIGRNGAGKSTLLKILARITKPTTGRVELNGRVGSLLEVGTGFHPELTGRENIYLSGAILGMHRQEINRKFDEIVTFSEIDNFLDTQVKHYSSGMYMRLAFAVAAHLEPEILLVDEVLAVGDAEFQKKCLGKMGDVAHEGRTVLFVSHNMAAIQKLCLRSINLVTGKINQDGSTEQVLAYYLSANTNNYVWERENISNSDAFFSKVFLCDEKLSVISSVTTASQLVVGLEFTIVNYRSTLQVSIGLIDGLGEQIFGSSPYDWQIKPPNMPGKYRAYVYLPKELFMPKNYLIRTSLWTPEEGTLDSGDHLNFFAIETNSLFNNNPGGRTGAITFRCKWCLEYL